MAMFHFTISESVTEDGVFLLFFEDLIATDLSGDEMGFLSSLFWILSTASLWSKRAALPRFCMLLYCSTSRA